jgi:hypothetical protein
MTPQQAFNTIDYSYNNEYSFIKHFDEDVLNDDGMRLMTPLMTMTTLMTRIPFVPSSLIPRNRENSVQSRHPSQD